MSTAKALLPPWLLDISATPPSTYKRKLKHQSTLPSKVREEKEMIISTESPYFTNKTVKPTYSKYWLKVPRDLSEPTNDLNFTTLIVSVTITIISSVVIVILFLFIRRQFQLKTPPTSIFQCSCPSSIYSYYGSSTNTTSTKAKACLKKNVPFVFYC